MVSLLHLLRFSVSDRLHRNVFLSVINMCLALLGMKLWSEMATEIGAASSPRHPLNYFSARYLLSPPSSPEEDSLQIAVGSRGQLHYGRRRFSRL